MLILVAMDAQQGISAVRASGFTKAIDPNDWCWFKPFLHQHDPFWNISQNDRIGMLVIELASRRRPY